MRFLRHPAQRVVLSSLLTQFTLVITGPLSVRLLGLEGRGEMAIVIAAILFVSQVGPWGLPQAFSYVLAQGRATPHSILTTYGPRFALRTAVVGLIGAVVLAAVAVTSDLLTHPFTEIAIMAAGTMVTMVAVLVIACLQGANLFGSLALIQLLPAVTYLLSLIVLTVLQDDSVVTVLLCYVGGWLLLDVIGLAVLWRKRGEVTGDPVELGELRAYGRRAGLASSAPLDQLGIDQLVVGLTLGAHPLGLFVVGLAFRTPVVLAMVSVAGVCGPTVAGLGDPEAQRAYCRRWLLLTLGVGTAAMLAVQAIIDPVLVPAFGTEAAIAEHTARILVLSALVLGWRRIIGAMLGGLGHPGDATRAEFAGLVVMVAGMAVLGALYGAEGAAWAVFAAGLTSCAVGATLIFVRLKARAADPVSPSASAAR